MTKEIVSGFGNLPKSKSPWRALVLAACAVLVNPLLGFIVAVLRPSLGKGNPTVFMILGFLFVLAALTLAIISIIIDIRAMKRGERSWVVWLGFAAAALVCIFWAIMFGGELFFME